MTDETATGGVTPPEPGTGASAKPTGEGTPNGEKPTGEGQGAKPDTPSGDENLRSALDKERDARRDAERRAAQMRDRVTELEDAGKSELERATAQLKRASEELTKTNARVTELEGELSKRDLDALKVQIAAEFKLSPTVAKRLQGKDARELRADAKSLAEELGDTRTGIIGVGRGGAAGGSRRGSSMNDAIREAAGRG